MKVLYQWAQRNPNGWQEVDAKDWKNLPKLPIPASGQLGAQSNAPGWIRNVNVQGITTEGYDHIAIEPITVGNDEGVKLTTWNDDPDDYPIGERNSIVWTILPIAPDPKLGMAINTRQSCIRYCEGDRYTQFLENSPQNTTVRPWSEFVPPAEEITRHGVWLENDKFQEHLAVAPQSKWGWMHWNEHLPQSETEIALDGRRVLKEQRKQGRYKQSEHTITYYQRDTERLVGFTVSTFENALELTTATSATQTATTDGFQRWWDFTTPANQPNSADWPSGDFHAQLNCTAVSGGVVYGINTSSSLAFMRISSDLTTKLENINPTDGNGDENDFSGTGLKLATISNADFSAGDADNRLSIEVEATGDSHGDAITLTLNTTDSYADGPWTTGETQNRTILGQTRIGLLTLRTILGRARLQKIITQTILGRARLQKVITQTVLGRSRIQKVVLQTILGRARIAKTVLQTILGRGRIRTTVLQTITGIANILVVTTVNQTILGRGRITKSVTQTIQGLGRIRVSVTQTILGRGRITVSNTQTILGKSRIQVAVDQTIDGIARVTVVVIQTILGRARITQVITQIIEGLSRIQLVIDQTIQGIARVTASVNQTILGQARITISTIRTIQGLARIQTSVSQTIQGRSRIQHVITEIISGIARITKVVNQTILGITRITASSNQTIQGKARITKSVTQTITGRGRIETSVNQTIQGKSSILYSKDYSRDDLVSLPANDNNLTTPYTDSDVNNVATEDSVFVDMEGSGFVLHQFKDLAPSNVGNITVQCILKSDVAPSGKTVSLQIFNQNLQEWETKDFNDSANADTPFELSAEITVSVEDYYNEFNQTSWRVYQEE